MAARVRWVSGRPDALNRIVFTAGSFEFRHQARAREKKPRGRALSKSAGAPRGVEVTVSRGRFAADGFRGGGFERTMTRHYGQPRRGAAQYPALFLPKIHIGRRTVLQRTNVRGDATAAGIAFVL